MDKIQIGEKRFSLEGESIEIKQVIAIELGFILATSESPIYPDINRLKKLIYVRDILLLDKCVLDYQVFDYITDEELDGLIKVLGENIIIPDKLKMVSKFDIYLWKARTLQPFNVYDFYKGVGMPDEVKCFDIVRTEELLLGHYLLYIGSLKEDEVKYNPTLNLKTRIYKTLKWFAYNNWFTTYGELFYKASENLISRIEAICLMSCENFRATRIFSVIRYFILLQNDPESYFFKAILGIKIQKFYKQGISRRDRRKILAEINRLCESGFNTNIPKYKKYIKAMDKRLHPKDYKEIYPAAYRFFKSFRSKSKVKQISTRSEIAQIYKENNDITEIAKLIYNNYGCSVFVNRFDSLARRAEKDRKETDILDLLIDAKIGDIELDYLEGFYNRRLYKLKASQNATSIPYYPKPCANEDFINCVLDVIKFKRNG